MEIKKDGEWMVTTPIYAGGAADVAKAAKCPHKEFKEYTHSVVPPGMYSVIEKCEGCIAVRSRYRQATPAEVEEWDAKRKAEQARLDEKSKP